MMVQYDNGFLVRVSGADRKLKTMAIDFHQNVFEVGSYYAVDLGLGDNFIMGFDAVAHNHATLLIGLGDQEAAAYQAFLKASRLTLGLSGQELVFTLVDVEGGLSSLEECYENKGARRAAVEPTGAQPPVGTAERVTKYRLIKGVQSP